jgi:hypothetical protein
MKEIGIVKMRTPQGRQSHIAVSVNKKGTVDIVLSRSSEGEALVMLPFYAATELSVLLALAVAEGDVE